MRDGLFSWLHIHLRVSFVSENIEIFQPQDPIHLLQKQNMQSQDLSSPALGPGIPRGPVAVERARLRSAGSGMGLVTGAGGAAVSRGRGIAQPAPRLLPGPAGHATRRPGAPRCPHARHCWGIYNADIKEFRSWQRRHERLWHIMPILRNSVYGVTRKSA